MQDIDEQDLDIAITLGASICKELGVCCDLEGKVIHKIYKKLRETHSNQGSPEQPEAETEELDKVADQPSDFD